MTTDTLPVSDRAIEAARSVAVRTINDWRRRDGLTCYAHDENRVKDEHNALAAFEAIVAPVIEREITQSTADRVAVLEAVLFADDGTDASYNLQGALDDLQGRHKVNDGGVIERTLSRVIDQLERARAALKGSSDGK